MRPSDSQNDTFDSYGPVLDKSVRIYMKDVECSEMNEKSNFRFLFFELSLFFGHFCSKNCQFSMNFSR